MSRTILEFDLLIRKNKEFGWLRVKSLLAENCGENHFLSENINGINNIGDKGKSLLGGVPSLGTYKIRAIENET